MRFALHPRLEADTLPVGDLPLCRVTLVDDARFPWLVLVPRRDGLRELFDLTAAERALLIEEVAETGRVLQNLTGATKMNVGAIGNRVSQLHLHVVARFEADLAWPAPVWGFGQAEPYPPTLASSFIEALSSALAFPTMSSRTP